MNQKSKLALAAAIVAVMVLMVAVFGYRERPETAPGGAGAWLPGLKEQLGELRRLRLQSSAEGVTLVHGAAGWGVEERAGYPADFGQLEKLLQALAGAQLVERKTAKPEFFDRLGLTDIEQPDSEAVQLEIWSDAAQPIARVLIGKAAEGRGGRYVRAVADTQTWLIDTAPEPMASPADWIDRSLLGVDFARVATVARVLGGKPEFSAVRAVAGEASLAVATLPAGKVPRYQSVFDAAARAILTAEPEDVRKAGELDFGAAAETRVGCFDGLALTVRALKGKDGNWVTIAAAAGDPVPRADAPPETPQPEDVAAEAERLNGRLGGWAFKVSDYVYGELAKGLADYVQDEQPAAGATPAPGAQPQSQSRMETDDE